MHRPRDLLPEVHFHSHDRAKLAVALLVGGGVAYALYLTEPKALHGFGEAVPVPVPVESVE